MYDLAVHGLTYSHGLRTMWVYVSEGRISAVSREPKGRVGVTIKLEPNQVLLPAATDLHVHLRDWKQAAKESVASGTMSAIAGGVTTVAEMPNTEPLINSTDLVEKRVELLRRDSYADFALHAGAPDDLSEIRRFRQAGAFAVKLYAKDLGRFKEIAALVRDCGLRLAVHAEDPSLVGGSREPKAELSAVNQILNQTEPRVGVRFAHISTSSAVSAVIRARRSRELKRTTLEVAPHHLFMTSRNANRRIGRASVVRPPLRSAANVCKMVRLLKAGAFDFYATDHAPHTKDEKYSQRPAPGFPGSDFAFPLLLSKTEDFALTCRLYCENPARYLGIRKGVISVGYVADLTILERGAWTIKPSRFVSMGRVTPFKDDVLHYRVATVIKEGELAYEQGRLKRPPVHLVGEPAQ